MKNRMQKWFSLVLVMLLLVGCTPAKLAQQGQTSNTTLNGVDIGKGRKTGKPMRQRLGKYGLVCKRTLLWRRKFL